MSDSQRYSKLARENWSAGIKLERAKRSADAIVARQRALRYEKLAKLAKLGAVIGTVS